MELMGSLHPVEPKDDTKAEELERPDVPAESDEYPSPVIGDSVEAIDTAAKVNADNDEPDDNLPEESLVNNLDRMEPDVQQDNR